MFAKSTTFSSTTSMLQGKNYVSFNLCFSSQQLNSLKYFTKLIDFHFQRVGAGDTPLSCGNPSKFLYEVSVLNTQRTVKDLPGHPLSVVRIFRIPTRSYIRSFTHVPLITSKVITYLRSNILFSGTRLLTPEVVAGGFYSQGDLSQCWRLVSITAIKPICRRSLFCVN